MSGGARDEGGYWIPTSTHEVPVTLNESRPYGWLVIDRGTWSSIELGIEQARRNEGTELTDSDCEDCIMSAINDFFNVTLKKLLPENSRNHLAIGALLFGAAAFYSHGNFEFARAVAILSAVGKEIVEFLGQVVLKKKTAWQALKPIDRVTDAVEWSALAIVSLTATGPLGWQISVPVIVLGFILLIRNVVEPELAEHGIA